MGIVVLASGGVDSAVLLARAQSMGELAGVVWANYGQPASLQEWLALRRQLSHLGITAPIHELPLGTVWAAAMQAHHGDSGPRVVPHRNLIMMAHALNWAQSIGADQVWYGATAEDHAEYVDCRPTWVALVNAMLRAPHGKVSHEPGIRVEAPLMYSDKPRILKEAEALGLLEIAWSCYSGGPDPCGTCNSCLIRDSP